MESGTLFCFCFLFKCVKHVAKLFQTKGRKERKKYHPIMTYAHAFSRPCCHTHVLTSSYDWFIFQSVAVIGYTDNCGFGSVCLRDMFDCLDY